MAYDLPKTQFLITDAGTHTSIKAFKRRRALMLFNKDGNPIRPITQAQWRKLQKDYPTEVNQDGLKTRNVWTLVEIKN